MKRGYIIGTHRVTLYVLYHFLLALVLLLATQAIFAIVNHGLFDVASAQEIGTILLGNMHYGISGTCMFLAPFVILYSLPLRARWRRGYTIAGRWLFGIPTGVMLAVNMIDVPYYQWTLRRMAGDIFGYVGANFDGGMSDLLGEFVTGFWYYFLIYFAFIFIMVWTLRRIALTPVPDGRRQPSTWLSALTGVLMLALTLTGIRGGWIVQHKPLAPIDACRYARSSNTALVVNTPFSIVRTLGNTTAVKRLNYFDTDEEAEQIFSPIHSGQGNTPRQLNVVLVILESFSEEYIGAINGGLVSYTPFLDSLAQYCQIYQGRANGKRSIESLPALMLGIPSLMDEPYITSSFSLNKTQSLPGILKRHGYESAFFHGAYNGSMNFDGFAKMIGIDHYYGMTEYGDPKDFDGTWGIFDEPFLQYSVRKMGEMREPFFATVYTISSHHPYTIPPPYKGRFRKGPQPIQEPVGYSDYAVQKFFEAASRMPWYQNTLFVITADHSAQPVDTRYKAPSGMYNVPMWLFHPGDDATRSDQLFQHADLLPTLLDYLQLSDSCCAFGRSALRDGTSFHIAYPGDYYQLTRKGELITFNGTRFEVFDLESDPLAQHDIANQKESDPVTTENKQFLKALVQQYNNRIIDNRLTPDAPQASTAR